MNEKIREIAEQAGSTHKQNLGVYQFYSEELEKFAELIVRECAGIAEYYYTRNECVSPQQIKRHFGVEE